MNYTANFNKAMLDLLTNEGGYTFNPKDPGGETKYGISKRSYPHLDIKNLTKAQAIAIYWQDFWTPLKCDSLSYVNAFELLDAAVNHGISRAKKLLQQAIGVEVDGIIGPKTLSAMTTYDPADMILRFQAYRIKFFTSLPEPSWDEFGRGWMNRVADNLLRDAVNN